jgi:hypothetical protein
MTKHSEDEAMIWSPLTPLERERIEQVGFRVEPGQDRTPEQLFRNWRHFVEEVDRGGYGWEVEEYIHSLWFREDLELVIGMIAPERQLAVRYAVQPWDLRFDAATDELIEPIVGTPPQPWWAYRAPRDPGSEFIASAGERLRYARTAP